MSKFLHFKAKEFAEAYAKATAVFAVSEELVSGYEATTIEPWLIPHTSSVWWIVALSEKPNGNLSRSVLPDSWSLFQLELTNEEILAAALKKHPRASAKTLEKALCKKTVGERDINGCAMEAVSMASLEELGIDFENRPFFSANVDMEVLNKHGIRLVYDRPKSIDISAKVPWSSSAMALATKHAEAVLGVGFEEDGSWQVKIESWDDKRYESINVVDRKGPCA